VNAPLIANGFMNALYMAASLDNGLAAGGIGLDRCGVTDRIYERNHCKTRDTVNARLCAERWNPSLWVWQPYQISVQLGLCPGCWTLDAVQF